MLRFLCFFCVAGAGAVAWAGNAAPILLSNAPPLGVTVLPESSGRVFSVFAMDPDGDPLFYAWHWRGSPTASNDYSYNLSTTWGDAGTGLLEVTVSDGASTNRDGVWEVRILSDNDGDGLPNGWENLYQMDPWSPDDALTDADHDFAPAWQEFMWGTNPTNRDTDGDSLVDGWEIRYGRPPLTPSGAKRGRDFRIVANYDTPGYAYDLDVAGETAYVADGGNMRILDFSGGTTITEVAAWPISFPFEIRDVSVDGNYAALATWGRGDADWDTEVAVLDISNPHLPVVDSLFSTQGLSRSVALYSNRLACGVAGTFDPAFHSHVYLFDRTDPSWPAAKSRYSEVFFPEDVVLTEDRLWIADRNGGVQEVDVSSATNPLPRSQFQPDDNQRGTHYAEGVALDTDLVCVAYGTDGIRWLARDDPPAPAQVATWDTDGYAYNVVVHAGETYVADGDGGLLVLSRPIPGPVQVLGKVETPGHARGLAVVSNLILVADGPSGVQIIEDRGSDADGDGLWDWWELFWFGSTTNGPDDDADGDGITNIGEQDAELNPLLGDEDGDGIVDGAEVAVWNSNPQAADTDTDGLPDGWEAQYGLALTVNDSGAHSDADGFSNEEEYAADTDPTNSVSYLRAEQIHVTPVGAEVYVAVSTGRLYHLERSALSDMSVWDSVSGPDGQRFDRAGLQMMVDTGQVPPRIYRIRVQRP